MSADTPVYTLLFFKDMCVYDDLFLPFRTMKAGFEDVFCPFQTARPSISVMEYRG